MDLPDIVVRGFLQDLNHYLYSIIDIDADDKVGKHSSSKPWRI